MKDLLARLDPRRRPSAQRLDESALGERLAGLEVATRVAAGRLPGAAVRNAQGTLARAAARREFSPDLTVVAFAGSTGAGKSTLFNAIVGAELARTGALRPTTAEPMAAVWGDSPAVGPLLDWLGVAISQRVDEPSSPASSATAGAEAASPSAIPTPREPAAATPDLAGLVLVDLPDHDSTEVTHRAHVDRLVARVDVMVWVLDPQKYADALVHDQYLKRYARHAEVTVVLLNQADRLAPADLERCLASLRELLTADGLGGARLIATSARTGQGLAELGGVLGEAAAARRASAQRIAADVAAAADVLAAAAQDQGSTVPQVPRDRLDALAGALTDAAGVAVVAKAVRESVTRKGRARMGWPITRWVGTWRRDPLLKMRLAASDPAVLSGVSGAAGDPVAMARAAEAVRGYVARASLGAPDAWVRSTRVVAMSALDDLVPALDDAVRRADVARLRQPRWWAAVAALQWFFLVVAASGALWLLGLAGLRLAAMTVPETPTVAGLPIPTLMLVGGGLIGLVLGFLASILVRTSADRAAQAARSAVAAEVAQVARTRIVEPVDAELATLGDFRIGLLAARGEA